MTNLRKAMILALTLGTTGIVHAAADEQATADEQQNQQVASAEQNTGEQAANGFAEWDTDDNDYIDTQEWADRVETEGFFQSWDTNQDDRLSEDEYANIDQNDTFANYDEDGDGVLSEDEFSGAFYDSLDADDSGSLELSEWDDADEQGWFDV